MDGCGWTPASRYLIRPGFSGGGLWSPDYQAVVGIVGQAHANGDGRAITLYQADLDLPGGEADGRWLGGRPRRPGEVALAQWGWALDRDPEGARHWRPRARGVSIDSERGWRFRGRDAALTADHRVAGPVAAGPAGAGSHRLSGVWEIGGPGPGRHHRRRRHPQLAARRAAARRRGRAGQPRVGELRRAR